MALLLMEKTLPNTITLNEISAVPWSNLRAYYQCRLTPLPMRRDVSSYYNKPN
jgi:hypothetical protein